MPLGLHTTASDGPQRCVMVLKTLTHREQHRGIFQRACCRSPSRSCFASNISRRRSTRVPMFFAVWSRDCFSRTNSSAIFKHAMRVAVNVELPFVWHITSSTRLSTKAATSSTCGSLDSVRTVNFWFKTETVFARFVLSTFTKKIYRQVSK